MSGQKRRRPRRIAWSRRRVSPHLPGHKVHAAPLAGCQVSDSSRVPIPYG